MPAAVLKKYAEQSGKTIEEAEECWNKSKERANKKYKDKNDEYWAYVNILTKMCLGIKKIIILKLF